MSTSGRTTSLATEELQVLNKIGLYLLQDTLNLVLETAFWAGYAVLFLFAVYIQVCVSLPPRPSKVHQF